MEDALNHEGDGTKLGAPGEEAGLGESARREGNIVEPENALPETTLVQLSVKMREACARAGWARLLPVQARAIPYLLSGRNVMVQSRTGSGKTAAYLLPLLERIDPRQAACQALVLAPTRELALQVVNEALTLYGDSGCAP